MWMGWDEDHMLAMGASWMWLCGVWTTDLVGVAEGHTGLAQQHRRLLHSKGDGMVVRASSEVNLATGVRCV